jgi:hypothetical protein
MQTGISPQHPANLQASRQQPSRVAGSEHKIGQESDKCSYDQLRDAWIRILGGQALIPRFRNRLA